MRFFLALCAFLVPLSAHAQVVYQMGNIFALFAGVLVAASFVFFGGGFVLYLARLGRPYRDEGLNLMQWGVAFMFVFIVCALLSRWWLLYPDAFPWVFAVVFLGFCLFYILPEFIGSGEEKKEEKH